MNGIESDPPEVLFKWEREPVDKCSFYELQALGKLRATQDMIGGVAVRPDLISCTYHAGSVVFGKNREFRKILKWLNMWKEYA